MPSLDDLKKRIKSVKSTQKITKAMKMVAAAKLRKAQESAEKGRPYSQKMQNIILNLTKSINDPNNAPKLLVGTGEDKKYLCVVLTADRGLCGGFNSNICKLAKINFKNILKDGKNLKIITVGSKGLDQIKREYGKYVIKKFSFKDRKNISFNEANLVGQEIISLFNKNEFEPDEDEILEDLLPKNISTQVFKALLENAASEQGSRMTAMDNATRNAGDLVDKLTINYNRSRQASITKELIEIISGAESL